MQAPSYIKKKAWFTFPGVGDADGVSVEVLLPWDDRCGVMEELPLVELSGDVVLDALRNADNPTGSLLLRLTI